jgi:glutathione S-transferase
MVPNTALILFQPHGRYWGMPNLSPFGTKLETYLRMAKWPYETRPADFRKAPKGKVPYVQLDGKLVGDSQLVMETLEARRSPEQQLDAWLNDHQRAVGHAVRRMLDEGTYFVLVQMRWVTDENWPTIRPIIAEQVGPAKIILPLIRRSVRKANRTQGIGRHTPQEVDQIGIADLTALARIIGDNHWLLGDRPSTYDASAYAFVEGIAGPPIASKVRDYLLAEPRLTGYRERVRAALWSDLPTVS